MAEVGGLFGGAGIISGGLIGDWLVRKSGDQRWMLWFILGQEPARCCSPRHRMLMPFKLSVRSGIEDMVTNPARPIRTVHFENPTDRSPKIRPGRDP
jgi:hypothetical protein